NKANKSEAPPSAAGPIVSKLELLQNSRGEQSDSCPEAGTDDRHDTQPHDCVPVEALAAFRFGGLRVVLKPGAQQLHILQAFGPNGGFITEQDSDAGSAGACLGGQLRNSVAHSAPPICRKQLASQIASTLQLTDG